MSRWHKDEVDVVCETWAYQFVGLFARTPIRAGETLGKCGSTLNLQRILTGDPGARGAFCGQSFPECFLGDGLLVSCILKGMPERQREFILWHYVVRWYTLKPRKSQNTRAPVVLEPFRRHRPMKQEIVAFELGISVGRYYELRATSKRRIASLIAIPPESNISDERAGKMATFA